MDSENDDVQSDNNSDFDYVCSSSSSETDIDETYLDSRTEWCRLDPSISYLPQPRFPFIAKPGLSLRVRDFTDPLMYFNLFFDEEIIDSMVDETNKYAAEYLNSNELLPTSRAQRWSQTDPKEMRLLLALLLLQGLIHKPVERWSWSNRSIISTPIFGKVMPEKRYSLLMKFLRFEEDKTLQESENFCPQLKLKKIHTISEKLKEKFMTVYIPERDLCVNESVIDSKGRVMWKPYSGNKNACFGFKTFYLCESSSGYVWNIIIYTGKDTPFNDDYENYKLPTKSVLTLVEGLLGKGYCIIANSFYCTPELAELLIEENTDIFGTLQPTHKHLPPEFKQEHMKNGEVVAFQKGKICILKWANKKSACMLSTCHSLTMVKVNKNGRAYKRPIAVADYNEKMRGLDKADQCVSYFLASRSQQRCFHKKIFCHLLNLSVWNSYILYKKSGGDLTHLNFRLQLIERLIDENITDISLRYTSLNCRNSSINVLRLTARHFPIRVPDYGKKKCPTRRCAVCSKKRDENGKSIRHESRYWCEDCGVGLCIDPCFRIYHTVQNY